VDSILARTRARRNKEIRAALVGQAGWISKDI